MSEPPWPVASREHTADAQRWMGNSRKEKGGRAAEHSAAGVAVISAAHPPDGGYARRPDRLWGLASSLDHLSIALNIATADSIAIAFAYDRMA